MEFPRSGECSLIVGPGKLAEQLEGAVTIKSQDGEGHWGSTSPK
jgi:hypothetical protein